MVRTIWSGATYLRGGTLRTKHGTTFQRPKDYRDRNTGVVVSPAGRIEGIEVTHRNLYGHDPKYKKGLKKPYAFVKGHSRKGSPVRNHTRRL